jgi:hypothetical protein
MIVQRRYYTQSYYIKTLMKSFNANAALVDTGSQHWTLGTLENVRL